MDLNSIAKVGPLHGQTLNIEEVAGLEVGVMQRKLQENLPGNFFFWGKVFGSTQDYLVVFHLSPYDEFPEKKFYYWWVTQVQVVHEASMHSWRVFILFVALPLTIRCDPCHFWLKSMKKQRRKSSLPFWAIHLSLPTTVKIPNLKILKHHLWSDSEKFIALHTMSMYVHLFLFPVLVNVLIRASLPTENRSRLLHCSTRSHLRWLIQESRSKQ